MTRYFPFVGVGLTALIAISFLLFGFAEAENNRAVVHSESFQIIFEKTENGLSIKSHEGTAWKKLAFSLHGQKVFVNQFGESSLKAVQQKNENGDLADFEFSIESSDNEFILKSNGGTAWEELKFSLQAGKKILVNEYGLNRI
ncbi:hypothetical protein [Persicobacter psychrovividus]|uniref:Uncharacterized protein n=1 Tax=Persicobacter psychrovividus TaxID=387638 RepID=A0ABM7VDV2_9BACT|nr:hypothetical protein PEPS_14210 [Persicobacter psychrovividus]